MNKHMIKALFITEITRFLETRKTTMELFIRQVTCYVLAIGRHMLSYNVWSLLLGQTYCSTRFEGKSKSKIINQVVYLFNSL